MSVFSKWRIMTKRDSVTGSLLFFEGKTRMLNKKKNPCYQCVNRHENCHANCKLYLDYKAKQDAIKAMPSKYNEEIAEYAKERSLKKRRNFYGRV